MYQINVICSPDAFQIDLKQFFLCHCVICKGYKWVPGKQSHLLASVWFPIRDHRGSEAFSSDLFHLALTQLHLSVCPSTHHSLTPSSKMPTSPSTRVQQPASRGTGGKKKTPLKGGLSQQRSCWHGNGSLCEWRLLLHAWSEVSHCLVVQEEPVRPLHKLIFIGSLNLDLLSGFWYFFLANLTLWFSVIL